MGMNNRAGALTLFACSAVFFFALDWASKAAVFSWLGFDSVEPFVLIPGWLQFNTAINHGGIWSVGARFGLTMNSWLIAFASTASVAIVAWAWFSIQPGQRVLPIVIGAILAGAIGNLHDRLIYSGVRDFIQFHFQHQWYFPTFNIADSCLVCGAIYLVLVSLFTTGHAPSPTSTDKPPLSASSATGQGS